MTVQADDARAYLAKRPEDRTPYDRAMRTIANGERRSKREAQHAPMNCDVMERTGDGKPIGRCCFGLAGGVCPRHGGLALIPSRSELP